MLNNQSDATTFTAPANAGFEAVSAAIAALADTANAVLVDANLPLSGLVAIAEHLERETAALQVLAARRAVELRNALREETLCRVTEMLNAGVITLSDITGRLAPAGDHTAPAKPATAQVSASVNANTAAPAAPAAPAAAPAAVVAISSDAAAPAPASTWKTGYIPSMNPAKFRDPVSGKTWSGRGPQPQWLRDLCATGKSLDDFRVAGANTVAQADGATEAAAANEGLAAPVQAEEAAAPAADLDSLAPDISFDATSIVVVSADADPELDGTGGVAGEQDDGFGDMLKDFESMGTLVAAANDGQNLEMAA